MAQNFLTDEEVEIEIAKLQQSPDVALARLEQRIRYRRRQYLYCLRNLEKKGKELRAAGVTEEVIRGMEPEEEDTDV